MYLVFHLYKKTLKLELKSDVSFFFSILIAFKHSKAYAIQKYYAFIYPIVMELLGIFKKF